MRDAAQLKNIPRLIQLILLSGALMVSSTWAFETNYERGRVDFAGRVTDISCSVALNGGNNAGSGSVWLAPVSLAEVHERGAGAFMKPQSFTLELSECQLRHCGAADHDAIGLVNVRWVDGFMVNAVSNENAGYLANTRADGARNIFLALSTNDNNTLDKSNKIVPADPLQNRVPLVEKAVEGGVFTYYIGYVTPAPEKATSGPLTSWATWELVYN
ncbi:fimbrial protein [Klebsiella oxytoca]|uniref:Type 1 fimbrial protein n=1 Tax=Klebsiella oxytoca TaxID=571 RepID=A0A6B8N1T6_KLEOX|nr:type 1 fimbrial protein [Klebsiella oxytoca]QGN39568.1 type 1 fimbrial protein [Klebsiella oxytoca]